MGNRCTPRRLQSDVWQRVAMDIERLPSISGFFRGSLQRVFQPLVPHAQVAARRCLHDAFAHDATRIQELLHTGTIRHLGRISHLCARIVKIVIVTPEAPRSTLGNAVTANRWAEILRELTHEVVIATEWTSRVSNNCDVLIALHARRSFPSIDRFHQTHAGLPLIVAMTGTDLYGDLPAGNPEAHRSIELATHIVVLQEAGPEGLPETLRGKAMVIYQSAVAPANPRPPRQDILEVCVLSHLRDVKDPLLAASAARLLPEESRVRIVHAGRALSSDWESAARDEERKNPRYEWLGDLPHD